MALLLSIAIATLIKRRAVEWVVVAILALSGGIPDYASIGKRHARRTSKDHVLTMTVLSQIRDLPKPAPNSRILFLSNPFQDWDTYFMANLVWDDHTLNVQLANKLDTPADLDQYQLKCWGLRVTGNCGWCGSR